MSIICLPGGVLGTNTYIVSLKNNNCFVVDPSVSASEITKRICAVNLTLTSVVLTHGHYDHMESLISLKKQHPHVKVYIHEYDSWALGTDALKKHESSFTESGLDGLYTDFKNLLSSESLPNPDGFLQDGDDFEGEWNVLHTPGHSAGSISLYNREEKLLICGDTLFYMGWGRTDLPGGDCDLLMQSLKRLSLLPPDVVVYPGHGRHGFTMMQNPIM